MKNEKIMDIAIHAILIVFDTNRLSRKHIILLFETNATLAYIKTVFIF